MRHGVGEHPATFPGERKHPFERAQFAIDGRGRRSCLLPFVDVAPDVGGGDRDYPTTAESPDFERDLRRVFTDSIAESLTVIEAALRDEGTYSEAEIAYVLRVAEPKIRTFAAREIEKVLRRRCH
jgi:hypothetical protein